MPGNVVGRMEPMPGRGTLSDGDGWTEGYGRPEALGSEGRFIGMPPAKPGRCMFGRLGRCIGVCTCGRWICGAGRCIGICGAGRFIGICTCGRCICCICGAGRFIGICGAGRAMGAAGRAIGAAGRAIGAAGRAIGAAGRAIGAGRPPPPARPRCATAGPATPATSSTAAARLASRRTADGRSGFLPA